MSFEIDPSLWGDVYEIGIKRGLLMGLLHAGLIDDKHPLLIKWQQPYHTVSDHLVRQVAATDMNYVALLQSALNNQQYLAVLQGQTVIREYLNGICAEKPSHLRIIGLWCPFDLPDRRGGDMETDEDDRLEAFWQAMHLPGQPDPGFVRKGQPGRSDFLLLIEDPAGQIRLLCLEISYNATAQLADFRQEAAHLDEMMACVRDMERRGAFSHVCAEVHGEQFHMSKGIISHLNAYTRRDKPLYKLCQGASYATRLVQLLYRRKVMQKGTVRTRVIALTSRGLEALNAELDGREPRDAGGRLMALLGQAYWGCKDLPDDLPDALDAEIRAVFRQIGRSLPAALRKDLAELLDHPVRNGRVTRRLTETVEDFLNPGDCKPREQMLAYIKDKSDTDRFLRGSTRQRIMEALAQIEADAACKQHCPVDSMTLRDLHRAAVLAALQAGRPGDMSVLSLVGHPGIGKTTALIRYLHGLPGGFLFLYISPRVVINADVTRELSWRHDPETGDSVKSGIFTATTNSRLIGGAARYAESQGIQGRRIDGAVVVDGLENPQLPQRNVLFLEPDEAEKIEASFGGQGLKKRTVYENLDEAEHASTQGVLKVLASSAHAVLDLNPEVDRIVLTAAIQSYRELGGKTTVENLTHLFRNQRNTPRGKRERETFARRIPNIIVMVDELAGDGAGAPLLHALARWLNEEFVRPFGGQGKSPFNVKLVIADASLGNEVVLTRFLENRHEAPDKVLVSASDGFRPFRLATTRQRLGSGAFDVFHVMADAFPARTLNVDYSLNFLPIELDTLPDGNVQSVREAINDKAGEQMMQTAVDEILRAMRETDRQVIFFAQNKPFLEALKRKLLELEVDGRPLLHRDDIGVLHGDVPNWKRRELVAGPIRDSKRIFLMTSSGARGVSFPKATHILAMMPRFSIESSLMEIAQLIYRGRGVWKNHDTGDVCGTDSDTDRRLVMIFFDFHFPDEEPDSRAWLRQMLDLLTLVAMLRATILTRLRGDAGVPGQNLAIVPVGHIGADEMEHLLGQHVQDFLKAAETWLADKDLATADSAAGLVASAVRQCRQVFANLRWHGLLAKTGQKSVASTTDMEQLATMLTLPNAPLVQADPSLMLPDNAYCVGPMLFESWRDIKTTEFFHHDLWHGIRAGQFKSLMNQAWVIGQNADQEWPPALARAARMIADMLYRDEGLQSLEHSLRREVGSKRIWVVVPAHYTAFCLLPSDEAERFGRRHRPLQESDNWRAALGRAATVNTGSAVVMPFLAQYEEKPFVVLMTAGDPTDIRRAFDDRYFMATSEFNLLNTLLFAREADDRPKSSVSEQMAFELPEGP